MPIKVRIREVELRAQWVQTRMPFRYGSAQLVRCPHLYVQARLQAENGQESVGIAADNLPPLWFDKTPTKSFAQQIGEQLQVIQWAATAMQEGGLQTPFQLWWETYNVVSKQAKVQGWTALLGGFGPSLLERALLDGTGKLLDAPFHALLHHNTVGVQLENIDSTLRGIPPRDFLPARPLERIFARHTVGLADPIRTSEIPPEERLNDGLPQSLDEVIRFYGVRYFKIKVQNQLESDIERLHNIASLLEELIPEPYFITLDGNEQYPHIQALWPLLEALDSPALARFKASILFLEQPLSRTVALDEASCEGLRRIGTRLPVIIDESDDAPDALPRALTLGYAGTSHKNCKNTFKSVANAARLAQRRQKGQPALFSAEDLTNLGPVALNQDLTVLSTLGIAHAERNGHHYFRGLSHRHDAASVLSAHPDLYTPDGSGARLHIENGQLSCASLHSTPGLGVGSPPDLSDCEPITSFDWQQ